MPTDPVEVELFGSLFVLMQHLTRRVDEGLAGFGLTSRQWLLLAVVEKAFPDRPPTLSDAAAAYGTSRQNVTQLAAQLERRGWIRLEPDPDDARAVCLVATDRISAFHDPKVRAEHAAFVSDVFAPLDADERRAFRDLVVRCIAHLSTTPPATTPPATTPPATTPPATTPRATTPPATTPPVGGTP